MLFNEIHQWSIMLGDISTFLVTISVAIASIIAAIQATKYGHSKTVDMAAKINGILYDVASFAVKATEQEFKVFAALHPELTTEELHTLKKDTAVVKAIGLIPADILAKIKDITPKIADIIESVVKDANTPVSAVTVINE